MIHHRHHQTTFNAICIDGYASGNDIAWCNILFYKGSWNLFRSQHVNKLMPHWKTSILFSGIFSAYVWLQLKSISRSWSLLWRDKVALQSFCHFYVYIILYNLTIHNYVINGQIVGKWWRRRIDGAALVRFKKIVMQLESLCQTISRVLAAEREGEGMTNVDLGNYLLLCQRGSRWH